MKKIACIMLPFFCLTAQWSIAQGKPLSAKEVLAATYDRAAKENKNVFLIFHASWCGWCHKLDSSMNDESCKRFFDSNYVTCHITVDETKEMAHLETPGTKKLQKKYNGEEAGLPFWLIFDKNGKLLADSKIRPEGAGFDVPGDNAGCPSAKTELAYFIRVLERTSRLTAAELAIIASRFSQNTAH